VFALTRKPPAAIRPPMNFVPPLPAKQGEGWVGASAARPL
jgi:hypothetical protein